MMQRSLMIVSLISFFLFPTCFCVAQSQFPIGWRHDGTGDFPNADPPTKWSLDENIVWKTEMPGKCYGAPIVLGDRIYLGSDPAELLCLNAKDGKVIWQVSNSAAEVMGEEKAQTMWDAYSVLKDTKSAINRKYNDLKRSNPDAEDELEKIKLERSVAEEKIKEFQKINPVAANPGTGNVVATPVTDGKFIYVVFGTGIVAAYDLDGKRKWIKFIEPSTISFGHTSSPVLIDGKLIVHYQNLIALDPTDGKILWKTELEARHASPIVAKYAGRDVVLVPNGAIVDPANGEVLNTNNDLRVSEGSLIVNDSIVYALGNKTIAFQLPSSSEKSELTPLWQVSGAKGRKLPSPVLHDGLIYAVSTEGILEVIDSIDGDSLYKKRLDLKDQIYSSVTAAGDYIFINSRRQGHSLVFKAGRKYEKVSQNTLEPTGSNPVFIGKRMYLRTDKHLFCIGK